MLNYVRRGKVALLGISTFRRLLIDKRYVVNGLFLIIQSTGTTTYPHGPLKTLENHVLIPHSFIRHPSFLDQGLHGEKCYSSPYSRRPAFEFRYLFLTRCTVSLESPLLAMGRIAL